MRYCKSCLNINTRPNIVFSESGLCPPCQYQLKPEEIDWSYRTQKLSEIIAFAKQNNQSGYDCIVGVSGGKDSTRQALHIKEHFGLKPLLVSMNYPPEQISQRGVDNLSNLITRGFDCINISCGPLTWKKAMRHAFLNYGNWAKATEFALFASVPRVAVAYQIPLIWWGESAALLLGDMGVLGSDPFDGNRLKYSNTLEGGNIAWLTSEGFKTKEILQYIYPGDEEMERANLRIVFMDYFMKDFSQLANGNFSALRGLSVRQPNPNLDPDLFGTSMLDEDFININMYIRYLKFGFGRTNDIVNLEIRASRMTREQAIHLVTQFDGNYDPSILEKFCAYLEISIPTFWETVDRYVNPNLFEKVDVGVYRPKFKVGVGL
ncbi:N-acetyl sugar amidotransferase [Cylindrospermopsis raciborskii]|uniref:N-acetyl sugar amidotransferase n=1 Tax=Cylindrospermopsis raciborskii TaxID=77022 RepID=UPI0022BE57D3|nr:N-acetyl sugar amidotransferase [Cylindrospermopsis raciborskii]MCZ2207717.1 N-acetyl sugar amidotransferase [Cylindrospermopsis raciborskii PAMP2011]